MVLFTVTVTLVALLTTAANAALPGQSCLTDFDKCTARFSDYHHVTTDVTDLTAQLLDQSFEFLFLSAAFNQHLKDRPGFEKLYRNVADQAWADAMTLMKYQSKRGYPAAEFNSTHELRLQSDPTVAEELSSLKMAMEYEKTVAEAAHAIHKKSSVVGHVVHSKKGVAHKHPAQYDPDGAHFFDEKIIKGRSASVRKLTGYIHMLNGILNDDAHTRDMGLHLFDQYLKTVE